MGYKKFKTVCVLRVMGIAGTSALFFFLLQKNTPFPLPTAVILIFVYQVQRLIFYVEKTNRDLARFLDAVKYADFSQTFTGRSGDNSFAQLAEAFSGVTEEIKKARSKTEEHYRYLQTIVQHVGIGMISFKENGDVELFNRTAKRIFGIEQLKKLEGLERFKSGLAAELLALKAGTQSLIATEYPTPMQLSVRATQFRMQGEKYTLVSVQNIQSELERERMAKELEIAHQVQINLLPKSSPQLAGVHIAGACIPAREVGGDYFDYIPLGQKKLGIAIGDVSGKGLPAAIYMTLTKGVLQSEAADKVSPKAVLSKVNKLMYDSITRETFVSMFYGILDLEANTLTYARAGHNPPVLLQNGMHRLLDAPGIGLGLDPGPKFNENVEEACVALNKGDWLICYTDGITEAMNEMQDEFGEQRLIETLHRPHHSPEAMLRSTHDAIDQFTGAGQPHDDMTMVAIQYTGTP